MKPIIDPLRDAAAYRVSIMAQIAPIVDDFILCKMKLEQLKKVGSERNHFNDSHKKMLETLQARIDNTKLDLLWQLEAPFTKEQPPQP